MGIGQRLKSERERLGYNQTDFAALAGAAKNSQYNYEKGTRSPDCHYLLAVAGVGVDIHYILTGEPHQPGDSSLSPEESELLKFFRQISAADQQSVCKVVSALAMVAGQQSAHDDKTS
ncbi:helix-turn-helix domain-containing protein [Pseudomonas sp. 5P_3.1_Bac2]|uniref:helix-turn-helix domain-containing protein n=1 Tax=Pseudomonas sp. 5P_3.1_Bac2 TaxID=2971617 RepID=UPI0021C8ECE6|nr:helix-turn-helix transcriptional regulator [Pseudomonas sp. 5P_3.1_Bac2]MCU1718683.1 helix-turn-helix domain-containing protein [Pseudomonas sp. 5P_3.1_Bac2]